MVRYYEDKNTGEISVGVSENRKSEVNWITSGRVELDYTSSITAGARKRYNVYMGSKFLTSITGTKKEAKDILKRHLERFALSYRR